MNVSCMKLSLGAVPALPCLLFVVLMLDKCCFYFRMIVSGWHLLSIAAQLKTLPQTALLPGSVVSLRLLSMLQCNPIHGVMPEFSGAGSAVVAG